MERDGERWREMEKDGERWRETERDGERWQSLSKANYVQDLNFRLDMSGNVHPIIIHVLIQIHALKDFAIICPHAVHLIFFYSLKKLPEFPKIIGHNPKYPDFSKNVRDPVSPDHAF